MRSNEKPRARTTDKRRARLALLIVVGFCLCLVAVPALASFPGQNGKIIWYSMGGDQTEHDVFEMKPNGDDQKRLRDDEVSNYDPQFSPNGQRIVYSTGLNALWVMNANGGNAHEVSANGAEDPSWVGNNKVVFMRAGELLLFNANGSGTPQFLLNQETETNEEEPDWSAVTNRVAFVREYSGEDSELFTVKLDGTKLRRLTKNNSYDDDPDWSPNSKRLSFTSGRDGDNDIFTMSAKGTGATNVSDTEDHDEEEASWSPNGMFFVYERHSETDPDDDIWKMKVNGDNQTPLTVNDYDDDNPDWQAL